jgi:hypothetical protein
MVQMNITKLALALAILAIVSIMSSQNASAAWWDTNYYNCMNIVINETTGVARTN